MYQLVKAVFDCLFLPVLALIVLCKEIFWQRQVRRLFYSDHQFQKKDKALLDLYTTCSPYKIAASFARQTSADDVHQFGSTPIQVYHRMATRWMHQKGTFAEFGSGTGRGLIFLEHFFSLKTIGFEINPTFVQLFTEFYAKYPSVNIEIFEQDYKKLKSLDYDWIYFYELFFSDQELKMFCKNLAERVKKTTGVISVSFPLSTYHPSFLAIDQFTASFPWGKTNVYLNVLRL